ncbi:MAG: hypothetical protein HZY76_11650 [Anaerolineae bacterium]|nr:MAG: hypothetical protein HZY76_11650 [Anaerolineae bacterium]
MRSASSGYVRNRRWSPVGRRRGSTKHFGLHLVALEAFWRKGYELSRKGWRPRGPFTQQRQPWSMPGRSGIGSQRLQIMLHRSSERRADALEDIQRLFRNNAAPGHPGGVLAQGL